MNELQTIPQATNPLIKGWKQPCNEHLLIDKNYAVMGEREFNLLYEYSTSLPSGTYTGKMWKFYDSAKNKWFLAWYGKETKKSIELETREILLLN